MAQDYHAVADFYAKKYGIPIPMFEAQINQESHFNKNAISPAGARGIAQIMPFWHVSDDPRAQLEWAAKHDRANYDKYHNWQDVLSIYNSGKGWATGQKIGQTNNYVKSILAKSGSGGAPTASKLLQGVGQAPTSNSSDQTRTALLSFLMGNLQSYASTGQAQPIGNLAQFLVANQGQTQPTAAPRGQTPTTGAPATGDWHKWVNTSKGADRSGMSTVPAVDQFVGTIGKLYGSPLTIGTGTNHNQYVVGTHRESQHWTGHAADIPMSGAELTRLGQTALIAAGMDPAKARKQTGGVYNVGKYQILFNTHTGGNHFNHLHVGVR